jgi:hypothetical protein
MQYVDETRLERCNPYQNTHVFFANYKLLMKDYVSYFYLDNFSSQYGSCGRNVFFKYRESVWYDTRCFSVVAAYWTLMLGVVGSNPCQVNTFFLYFMQAHVILHCTKNYHTKILYFPKIYDIHHFMVLLQVASMSIPPHVSVRPPCWYYVL